MASVQTLSSQLKLASIVGARPQFVKLGPIARAIDQQSTLSHSVINTGQHYDDSMSRVFFDELALPKPDVDLEIGSGNHGMQTGRMMEKLEACFVSERPHAVIVYGDTNSTLAATLVAAKLHIPIAHIEAGLRSFNRSMPEEINRVAVDHCSDRLYAPTPTGMENLQRENLAERALLSGDIMRDAVMYNIELAQSRSDVVAKMGLGGCRFGLLTLHRPVNTTETELARIMDVLGQLDYALETIVFPIHPRTKAMIESSGIKVSPTIRMIAPLPYLDMLSITSTATLVLTDSGGLQKEAAFLETPCITLRDETEWVETLDLGVNLLCGTQADNIKNAIEQTLQADLFDDSVKNRLDEAFGAGNAAQTIISDLENQFRKHS